jgi:hypothetical protein
VVKLEKENVGFGDGKIWKEEEFCGWYFPTRFARETSGKIREREGGKGGSN